MNKSDNEIYEKFVTQLTIWAKEGKLPDIASLDLNYSLDLQRKRLENNNAYIEYKYEIQNEADKKLITAGWNDQYYENTQLCRSYMKTTDYLIDGRVRHHNKENQLFYAIITRMKNQNPTATYCCPSCGEISPVSTLLTEGCPSCKTRFIMSDLYPKVVNYFFLDNVARGKKSKGLGVAKWLIMGAIAGVLIYLYSTIASGLQTGAPISELISSAVKSPFGYVMAGGMGFLAGYFVWAIVKIGSVFSGAFKSAPMMFDQIGSKGKLPNFMRQFDQGFSYEFFVGKVLSLYKAMIFSDDYNNLAIYDGPKINNNFKNIIDTQYGGAIGVNSMYVDKGYCYLNLKLFVTNTYCKNNSIKVKDERFNMVICKSIMQPYDYGFSIRKVQCKSCGASFNAVREHNCPYCHSSYNLRDDDWVVLSLTKK